MIKTAYYRSELGMIRIQGDISGISDVDFTNDENEPGPVPPELVECHTQIDEYFHGKRKKFDLKLNPAGTEFQIRVWKQLENIPYGKTASYRDVAMAIGNKNAARAVGMANARNPISIIVPCHRVIGKDGSLTGYGGGLDRKKWLLEFEMAHL
jgi:methylated-DNA-[protein]-cysteine S-methyltransferase